MKFEKEYFDQNYHDYYRRNPAYKLNFYLKVINKYAPKAKSLLDAGCAFGPFLKVAEQKFQISGFDISRYAIKQAKKILPKADLTVSGVETFSFKNKFDVITLFDVIEHIPNLDKTFTNLNNHLNKDGIVVFVMPVYDGPTGKIVNFLDPDETHINKLSRKLWLKKISKEFKIIKWLGIYRYKIPHGPYIHIATSPGRSFSPAILVVAGKK